MSAEKLAAVVLAPVGERIEDVRSRAERLGVEAEGDSSSRCARA